MKVVVKEIKVGNSRKHEYAEIDLLREEEEYDYTDTLSDILYNVYSNQGNVYKKVFGVPWEVAEVAGWHPEDSDFSETCEGWEQAVKADFKVSYNILYTTRSLKDVIREVYKKELYTTRSLKDVIREVYKKERSE